MQVQLFLIIASIVLSTVNPVKTTPPKNPYSLSADTTNSLCFDLVMPSVTLLMAKRDQGQIIRDRQRNAVWRALKNNTPYESTSSYYRTAESDPEFEKKIHDSPHEHYSLTCMSFVKKNSVTKIMEIKFNPESPDTPCKKTVWHSAGQEQQRISEIPIPLIHGLCKAVELNTKESFICALIKKLYTNDSLLLDNKALYTIKSGEDEHTYQCTPLHISALRFSHKPTPTSKSIIAALVKAGVPLNCTDNTESGINQNLCWELARLGNSPQFIESITKKTHARHTPLELLTDDELSKLITDECFYIKHLYLVLGNLYKNDAAKALPQAIIEKIMDYVVGQKISHEILCADPLNTMLY